MDAFHSARRAGIGWPALALLGLAPLAAAQDFPAKGKPIRIVVGFTAGGGTDAQARIVAQKLGELLGTSVIVDNKPGASTMLGRQRSGARPARRLHPALRALVDDGAEPAHAGAGALRPLQGLHADLDGRARPAGALGEQQRAGQQRARAGGLRQGAPRHGELCLLRRGHLLAHLRRGLRAEDRPGCGAHSRTRAARTPRRT